jgi:hypothetical protein
VEGTLILRDGLLCRVILTLTDETSPSGPRKLEHRDGSPCERVYLVADNELRLTGLPLPYVVRVQ